MRPPLSAVPVGPLLGGHALDKDILVRGDAGVFSRRTNTFVHARVLLCDPTNQTWFRRAQMLWLFVCFGERETARAEGRYLRRRGVEKGPPFVTLPWHPAGESGPHARWTKDAGCSFPKGTWNRSVCIDLGACSSRRMHSYIYVSVSGLEEEVFPVLMDNENTAWPFSSLVVINYLTSLSDLPWRRHALGINGNGKERKPVCRNLRLLHESNHDTLERYREDRRGINSVGLSELSQRKRGISFLKNVFYIENFKHAQK